MRLCTLSQADTSKGLSGDLFELNLALPSCAHTLYKVLPITDHRFGRTRGAKVHDIAK